MAEAETEEAEDSYQVSIKRSARRINATAAEWVAQEGSTRTFESKTAARDWAETITADPGRAVRIQDVTPHDRADVDGYLVADPVQRRRTTESTETDGTTRRSLAVFKTVETAETDESNDSEYIQTQF